MTSSAILEAFEIVCVICGVPELVGKVRFAWNSRFIARMGDARWSFSRGHGLIRLSSALWQKATDEAQMETVAHEACHVIADYRFGSRQKHGPRWRQMMRLCGYENPRRCHTVDLATIQQRRCHNRHRARCGCMSSLTVGPIQAKRIRTGRTYRCRRCGQAVQLESQSQTQRW